MQFGLRTFLLSAAAIPPLLFAAWHAPAIKLASNCGGNNAARVYLSEAVLVITMLAEESPSQEFCVASATPAQRQQLATISTGWGVAPSDIWITTQPIRLSQTNAQTNGQADRQIVAICSRPFRNVPQYMFRQAPPTHAVAYSDGRTALISPREFAALDRAEFAPLVELVTP